MTAAASPATRYSVPCPRKVPVCLVPSSIDRSVGSTALIPLREASRETGCNILAKAEFLNPGGSIKDRIAAYIIDQAERRGDLKRGDTIMEVSSGNTGIALAMIGALRGYRVIIHMPRTVSDERRGMIEAFGAQVRLLDDLIHMRDAIEDVRHQASVDPTIFLPSQFSNADNPRCHECTTGPEIIEQVRGMIDAFVMGVGTGGTLMGVARALRTADMPARIVAVEPDESAVMSGGQPHHHGIQGLADGFIPDIVRLAEIDWIERVATEDALRQTRRLAREEGLLVGISSGANVLGAVEAAHKLGPGHTVVTVLPDRGERYLSIS